MTHPTKNFFSTMILSKKNCTLLFIADILVLKKEKQIKKADKHYNGLINDKR